MMQKSLIDKLQRFNPQRPYIWELKITEKEFCSLEDDLRLHSPNASESKDALNILVYIAEWYKRRYTNRAKNTYQTTFNGTKPDLQMVWHTLGINSKYLYMGENGQKLYLYSTFILSGLAVKFEGQKNEKQFLKALCRVYNKEDGTIEQIVDNNHSIPFKESIARGHCLRDFLNAIINSQENAASLPYAKEDIDDRTTEIGYLIDLIYEINQDVNKSKFFLEWIVRAIPGNNFISRRLLLWLNPEENGRLHQILRIDRLKRWGFENPEDMHYIKIGLRYFRNDIVIKEPDFLHPDLYFSNTGNSEVGFICEKIDYVNCNNVPVIDFDKVTIVAWNEDGKELPNPIQEEEIHFDTMQFYHIESGRCDWSSKTSNQSKTALLFSKEWKISEMSVDRDFETKTLYNKQLGEGDIVQWSYINVSLTITNNNESITYYNRQGYDRVVAKLYKETIHYIDDGKVIWHHSEDEFSDEILDAVPIIFGKKDIIVYHTETKDDVDSVVCEQTEIELCEYKNEKGYYTPWTNNNAPLCGLVEFRLTIRGRHELFKAYYLSTIIRRDLVSNTISYNNGEVDMIYDDKACIEESEKRRQIIEPTVMLKIGTGTDYIDVPVFRPIAIIEVCHNDSHVTYLKNDTCELPYILREHITLHSFGDFGFNCYRCSNLSDLHKLIIKQHPNNKNAAWASSAAWERGELYNAMDIDANAPSFLKVKIGDRLQTIQIIDDLYFWDYNANHTLKRIHKLEEYTSNDWGIIFQSNKKNRFGKVYYPYMNEEDDDIFDEVDHYENTSLTLCFKIAVEHNLYFFTFTPLKQLSEEDFQKKLLIPLLDEYKKHLPLDIHKGLLRFLDEFQYKNTDKLRQILYKWT